MFNRVFLMDCLEFMKDKPDKYYDLCITDPPYGINLNYNTYIDTEQNWYNLIIKFIPEAKRISKMLILPCMQIAKLDWIYNNFKPDWLICWYKGSPGQRSYIGFNDWEPLLVYGKISNDLCMHDYFQTNEIEKKGNYGHPCPKPYQFYSKIIEMANHKNKIKKIFDPFSGSGTCRLVCYDKHIDFEGCEIDADYWQAQEDRFKLFKAKVDNEFYLPDNENNLFDKIT